MQLEHIWLGPASLGEGPLWQPAEHALYWVDIVKPALHRLDPITHQHQSWLMPEAIGCIGLRAQGGLIAALGTGFATIDLPSGKVVWLEETILIDSTVMFNDGKCDQQGRFWAGTKAITEDTPIAALLPLGQNGVSQLMAKHYTVTNGIGWNLTNTLMYVTDSPARRIYQYDFDARSGAIANRQIFAEIAPQEGYPDGLTVDSLGYIWSAHWDGWKITRYHPNGRIDQVIDLPVQRPTSCCFGGADLSVLYITSASLNLSSADLAKGPLAGAVFALQTDVQGLPEPAYQA